jgi:hypothetical protein
MKVMDFYPWYAKLNKLKTICLNFDFEIYEISNNCQ